MPKKCSKTLKQNTQKVMETICQNAEKKIFEKNAQENVENMFLKVLKKCWKKCWNAESVESAESA